MNFSRARTLVNRNVTITLSDGTQVRARVKEVAQCSDGSVKVTALRIPLAKADGMIVADVRNCRV